MNLSFTEVPIWLSILFILSFSTVPIFLIGNAVKNAFKNEEAPKGKSLSKKVMLFYWAYLGTIGIVSLTGFFNENVLPPRIILCTTLPLLLFYLLYVNRAKWFKQVLDRIKLEQLIVIHTFRFVGVFFFLAYHYEALPKEFAFIGGTGDVLTALLVFPVLAALRKKRTYAKSLVWIWNIIGLMDITSVLITAIMVTRLAIENNTAGVQEFGSFPFSWIPAFAPATIIFLHLLVFKKLNRE